MVKLNEDEETNLLYAIKEVPKNDKTLENKQIEMGKNNEYLVKYFGSFEEINNICLVFEYMDFGSLRELINCCPDNIIPEKFMSLIFYQIIQGLLELNDGHVKIIHRDLKPENILINTEGKIKLADFGVSAYVKNSDVVVTSSTSSFSDGTYAYMSPERINQSPYRGECDIWSLGVIMLECIKGKYPFEVENIEQLQETVAKEKINNLFLDVECQNEDLINLIKKCLQFDCDKRPRAKKLSLNLLDLFQMDCSSLKMEIEDFQNWLNTLSKIEATNINF